jgi:hypothetical protein
MDVGLWCPSVLQMPVHGETKFSLLEIYLLDSTGSLRAVLHDLVGSEVLHWVGGCRGECIVVPWFIF